MQGPEGYAWQRGINSTRTHRSEQKFVFVSVQMKGIVLS